MTASDHSPASFLQPAVNCSCHGWGKGGSLSLLLPQAHTVALPGQGRWGRTAKEGLFVSVVALALWHTSAWLGLLWGHRSQISFPHTSSELARRAAHLAGPQGKGSWLLPPAAALTPWCAAIWLEGLRGKESRVYPPHPPLTVVSWWVWAELGKGATPAASWKAGSRGPSGQCGQALSPSPAHQTVNVCSVLML